MRRRIGAITTTLLAIAGLAVSASPAQGQPADGWDRGEWAASAAGGIDLPFGELAEVQDLGPAAEAAVFYRIHPRVSLRGDGRVAFLQAAPAPSGGRAMPDMRVFRFHGGVDVLLWSPGPRTAVTAGASMGAAVYDTEAFASLVENPGTGTPEADFNETFFDTSGRLAVSHALQRRIRLFATGGVGASFGSADATALFHAFDPAASASGSDVLWTVPVSAGAEIRF